MLLFTAVIAGSDAAIRNALFGYGSSRLLCRLKMTVFLMALVFRGCLGHAWQEAIRVCICIGCIANHAKYKYNNNYNNIYNNNYNYNNIYNYNYNNNYKYNNMQQTRVVWAFAPTRIGYAIY